MKPEERTEFETKIVDLLKTVYDPEIPVDIYNLGLIYRIEVTDDYIAEIDMTFTAPTCPAAEFILEDVRQKVSNLEGIKNAVVQLIFEPAWNKDMMSEEAKVDHGLL